MSERVYCSGCLFFEANPEEKGMQGACMRYPPTLNLVAVALAVSKGARPAAPTDEPANWVRPIVFSGDGCGEWRKNPELDGDKPTA